MACGVTERMEATVYIEFLEMTPKSWTLQRSSNSSQTFSEVEDLVPNLPQYC